MLQIRMRVAAEMTRIDQCLPKKGPVIQFNLAGVTGQVRAPFCAEHMRLCCVWTPVNSNSNNNSSLRFRLGRRLGGRWSGPSAVQGDAAEDDVEAEMDEGGEKIAVLMSVWIAPTERGRGAGALLVCSASMLC